MSVFDPIQGKIVQEAIAQANIEGPYKSFRASPSDLEQACSYMVSSLGIDLGHPSTKDTPARLARMYQDEVCYGMDYANFPRVMTVPANGVDEIVLERNIKVHSLCEHHMVPIIGVAHVAYIPDRKLIGLSKINRIVDFFSRRPQLQERLGEQIVVTLRLLLGTDDVAIIIKADHFCVKYRGVQDPCSDTVTSKMSGKFREVPEARAELMSLIALR